jgi:isocitrate/isopropylmalate dehydrogenase
MADINNNDIWIDVETLAKLKNITRRAVRLALNQNKYEYKVENIRGGKTYKIKLSTLEEELQLKYFQEYYDDYKTCENREILVGDVLSKIIENPELFDILVNSIKKNLEKLSELNPSLDIIGIKKHKKDDKENANIEILK